MTETLIVIDDIMSDLLENSQVQVEVTEQVLPEHARPFQAITFDKNAPLSVFDVLEFLTDESKAISEMPFKPKAGEVYLFKAKSKKEMNNWRANGHRFYQARGGKWICGGLIQRRVFNLVTPTSGKTGVNDFQMFSWSHRDNPLCTLVQFVGDESASVDFPHKNSKKGIPYVRSAPSVLRDLEIAKEKPFRTYQQETMNAPPDATTQNLLVPRNISQVRNAKHRFTKQNSGSDRLTNLIRISLEYQDIRLLTVAPDLIMVSITPVMLEQVRTIMKLDYDSARQKQLLGYDTQFNLGDYYVSWITIRDIRYTNSKSGKSPILPAVQVFHERKLQLHHNMAWSIILDLIPEIGSSKFVATSDDEFTALLERYCSKGLVSKCEIHGAKKIERWVTSHGGKKEEGKILNQDFRYVYC